jgi:phosphatidylinositol alpha-1,6-mannosyltransferase
MDQEASRDLISESSKTIMPGYSLGNQALDIVLLTDSFLPHAGGSRVYYFNLYKRLAEQYGDRVTVLTNKMPGWRDFDCHICTDSFRIIRQYRPLPNWKYRQYPKMVRSIARAFHHIYTHPADLLHTGDILPQGLAGMWTKKALGLPYIAYCHGEDITQIDSRRYQPAIRDAIYRNADAVIAANEFARRNLVRIGVEDSAIYKLTPGVDSERFSPRQPRQDLVRQFGLQGKTVLLSVGRLVARKGHGVVLRALAQLQDRVPPFHYLIAGEGSEEACLHSLVREFGLLNRVTFLGKVPDTELADFYALSDLFVLVNREVDGDLEGFGMVFLEANAAGKAVLGGRTGGTAEAVIDNSTGLLVDPENIEETRKALELLLLNADLRNHFGERGRCRAVSEFSWEDRAHLLHEICADVLNRHRTLQSQRSS